MSDIIDPKDIVLTGGLTTDPVIDPALIDISGPNPFILAKPSTLTDDRSRGIDNSQLDLNRPFHMDLNEHRAQRQTNMEKWLHGFTKGGATLISATGESFGAIGGGIAAGTMVALGNDWDSDIVFKNPVLTFFKEWNEHIKEINPNYYSEAEINASVLSNLATVNFWSDKFLDGLGFLGSALLTGLGAASIGAKLGLTALKLGKVGAGLNSIQAAIAGRTGESAIEANETYERVIEELTSQREAGENNFSNEEIEERAKTARASVFGFNMALAVTDAYQLGKVFKTVRGQKVGKGLFGGSRVGHAAEQAFIESQEENYQLAVSNMAINMANNITSPENEAGAGEYIGRIVGGMMDNFGTKEGQEAMVLGGLLGGGMGLAFKTNDRTEKAKKDVGNEFLETSNSLLHIFKNDIELEAIKKLALGKGDMVTVRLAETNQLINLVYSKIITNKFEDFQKEIDGLATEKVEELKEFDVVITEEERAQQYADIKPKISLYKAFYDTIDSSLHKAIKGNLYYLLASRDAIQKELLAVDEKLVVIDALIERNKKSEVEISLTDPLAFGTETIIPAEVLADRAKLKENEQVITEQLNKVKDNPIVQDAIISRYEKGITKDNPNFKPTEDPDALLDPLGTVQKVGESGKVIPFYKKTENDNGTITYTIKDEEGKESIITAQPEEYVESNFEEEDVRGDRIEHTQFNKHEVSENFKKFLPALRRLIAEDPNWRTRVVVRIKKFQNQHGSVEERIAAYEASGQKPKIANVQRGFTDGAEVLLIPSTLINFEIFIKDENGVEGLVGHVVDPFKFTDSTGVPIDYSQLTEEEFYEIFAFKDLQGNQIQDDVRYAQAVREQAHSIEFFEAVSDWAETQEDNAELPAEFMDIFTKHEGWQHTEVGEWSKPKDHDMLKDPQGNYVIVDTRGDTPFKSIVDGAFYGDELSEETLEQLENTRYIVKIHHPTVKGLWAKAAPKNMTQKNKVTLVKLIKAAVINPTQKQIDELNSMLYIAYKQSWNFAFDIKKNKGKANELRLDVFNRPAGIAMRDIIFEADVPFININQIATMLKTKANIDLGDFAFKENLTKDNITNDQVEDIFTINVTPDVIKGVGLHFGFKTDKITLKPGVESTVPVDDLKAQAQSDVEDSSNEVDNPPFKKSSTKAIEIIDIPSAKKWLKSHLPAGMKVDDIDKVLTNLEDNQYTWGMFADNVIYLSKFASIGTEYHEAFHAIFRNMASKEERKVLYKEATKKWGSGKSPLFYEEKMADEFMQWKLDQTRTLTSTLRRIFKRIVSYIKMITKQGTELEILFRRIDHGAFANKTIKNRENIEFNSPAWKLLKGGKRYKMSVVRSEDIIYTAASHVLDNIGDLTWTKDHDTVIETMIDEHMDTQAVFNDYKSNVNKEISKDPKVAEQLADLEAIYLNPTNRELVKEEVKKLLDIYEIRPKDVLKEEDDANEESERRFDIHQGEVGGWKNINKEIKQFIAITAFTTTDDFNRKITRAINFIPTFTLLQRALAGKERPEQLKEFASRARYDPQVKAVYEKFIKQTGYKRDGTVTNEMLFNRFLNSFELFPINSIQALRIETAEGDTQLMSMSANQNTPEKIHVSNWERTAHNRNVFATVESRNKAGNILLKSSGSFNLTDPKKILKPDIDRVVKAFEPLGIDLSPGFIQESLEEYYGLRSKSGNRMLTEKDISVLAGILKKGDDLYSKKIDESGEIIDATAAIGTLTEIAKGDIMYRSDIYETNFQNSQNKSIFAFVLPSYILHRTRELANMTPAKLEQLRNDPYFKYNPLIKSVNAEDTFENIEAVFTGDYRDTLNPDKEGITFKDTTPKNLLLTLYGLYNSPNKYSYFTPMIYEAKSTSISIKLPRKEGGWLSKGKLSKASKDFFIETLFKQEHQRINGETGIDFITHKSPWVTLPFFNNLKYKDRFLTDYSLEEIDNNKGLNDFIGTTIAKGLMADIEIHKQDMVDYGIFQDNNQNLLNLPQNKVEDYITNFYLDDFVNSVSISQLLTGDLAKFKNSFDNVKRMAGILAYGSHFGDGTYNVVYKEADEVDNTEYGNSKRIDRDDAQVYVSVQRRINQLARHGRLDAEKRTAYEKIRDGNDLTEDELKVIDAISLKTVHFDGNVYHKMSEMMLSRAMVSKHILKDGKGIWVAKKGKEKLHNMLEFMTDNEIDSVVTLSASKMQRGKNSITGKQATVLTEADFVNGTFPAKADLVKADLKNKYIRVQVEMRSGKDKIVSGTQMAQLIDSLYNNPKLQNELYQLMADNRLSDFEQAKFIADPDNVEKLADKLIRNLESTGGDAQIIKLLETEDAGDGKRKFKFNINLPHIAEKIEQLMLSHYSKGVLQQKVPGYKLTLAAAAGYQIEDKLTGEVRDLKMHTISKDGKTIELAEVAMTRRKLGQILGRTVQVEDLAEANKELIKMIGVRIPTQAHHSMIPFEVVEFLPEFMGDTVIAPAGITKLSGADYDIDSLFVYRKDFYKDGNVIITYGNATTDEALYKDYNQYHLDNNIDLKKTFSATKIAFPDFTNEEVRESVFADFGLAGTFKEFKQLEDKITNAARNNRMVEIYLEILTDPAVEDMFRASSLDLLHSTSSTYYAEIKDEGNKNSKRLHHSLSGKLQSHKDTSTGKRNVGPIAAANNTSAFMTKSKINMRVPLVFLGKKYWSYSVKEEDDIIILKEGDEWKVFGDDRADKSKVTSLSTFLSGMTDDAKWGFSNMLNLKQYNIGVFANMISLGMGFNRTMLFATQPVLVELSKVIDQSDLSETKTITNFIDNQAPINTDIKLTEELLLENLTKNDPEVNALIMQSYAELNKAARKFQVVGTIIGLNKGLEVNNLVDFHDKVEKIEIAMALPNKPFFTNLNTAVHANPNTHHNLEILHKIKLEMRQWFIAESSIYKTTTDILRPTLKTLRDRDAKTYDRALKSFLTFVGLDAWLKSKGVTTELVDYNALVNPSVTTEEITKTLAKQISELAGQEDKVKAKAFNTNEFIKVIQTNFKYTKEGFRNTKNKLAIDNVISSMRIQRSPLTVDRIRDGFVEIFLEYPTLARNFLKFAIAKDNLQFTSSSFLKYIDEALLVPISEGLDQVMTLDSTEAKYEFAKLFVGYKMNERLTRVTPGVRPLTKEVGTDIVVKSREELTIITKKTNKDLSDEDIEVFVNIKEEEQTSLPYIIKVRVNENITRLLYKPNINELRWIPLVKYGTKAQLPYHNLTYERALQDDAINSKVILSDKANIDPKREPETTPPIEVPPVLDVANLASKEGTIAKSKLSLSMYFKYGDNKRSDVKSESTFEAIKVGERTSTLRKRSWYSTQAQWNAVLSLKKGDIITFFAEKGNKGESIQVRLTRDAAHLTIGTKLTDQQLERLSKMEGWSAKYLAKQGYQDMTDDTVNLQYAYIPKDSESLESLSTKELLKRALAIDPEFGIQEDFEEDNLLEDEDGNLRKITKEEIEEFERQTILNFLKGREDKGTPFKELRRDLSAEDSTENLISYNFTKAIEKLSKRFNVPVELVYQKDANWRGRYRGGVVFLNTAHLTSDTAFHEFAHPFVQAIAKKNPTLYASLKTEIIREQKILKRVTQLYPELDYNGRIDEAIVTSIGIYAGDKANLSRSLLQIIKDFLIEMMHVIRMLTPGLILPAELNPNTTLRDLGALMSKGNQIFKLGDLSKDELKSQKQQATKLTVQPNHVDLVRNGAKTLSLRDYEVDDEDRIVYVEGDELTIYAQGREQGITVKVTGVKNHTTMTNVNKEELAKALGYDNFAQFIKEDPYAKEDSEMSMKFPAVYHFIHDSQSMQFLTYEVVREFETGAETELETKVKEVKEALIKQINKFKSQIVETNPKRDIAKLYVKRSRRLLKALDAIDDAKGLMSYIDEANTQLKKLRIRLEKTLGAVKDIHTISTDQRKHVMNDIFEIQEAITAYHVIDELRKESLLELIGESETTDKFIEAKENFEGIIELIDKNGIPMMASWLLSFSNVNSGIAQKEFDARIARIKENEMSPAKKTRIIKKILLEQDTIIVTQESLEDQLRAATRDIGYGALLLEAAISSSDQVTSLFAKAVKTQEWRANMIDRVTQERIGVALDAFEGERKSKGVNPAKFYKDLYEEIEVEKNGPLELVLKRVAPTKAGQDLLNILHEVYNEAQGKLPESVKMGNILPYTRKSGSDRLQEDGFFATMKAEWKEIYTPLATDTAYGYMKADGTPIKQVPIHYVYRGEDQKAMTNDDISKDLVHSILSFAQMANKYEAFKNIQAEVDSFEKIIQQRIVKETDAQGANIIDVVSEKVGLAKYIQSDTTRVNQRVQEFINMQYYGIQEKPWIVSIGEQQVDINKFLNFLGRWTGFSTLALNFLSALNNIVLGNFYIFQEALARQHYGDFQFKLGKGNAIYFKGIMRMFSDIGKITGLSKETQLINHFDAIQGEFRGVSGDFVTGPKAKKLFIGSTLFFLNHAGEHQMQSSTLFAALASKQVKTTTGEEISLWDAYQLDSKGVLELREGVQFSEKEFFEFRGKLNAINKSLHGNYNDFDKTIFQKHAIGRLILMFRKFMSPGFRRRFGNLGFDNESDELHEGFFRTTMRLVIDEYREFSKWVMRKENSLTSYEKANVRKTVAEFGMWISTMIMFALASAAIDDDKDDWLNALALYEIRRFQTELSFYFNPAEGLKIFSSPAATTTTIERAVKFTDQLIHTAMFDTEYTHYQMGGHGHQKGDSKLWVSFKKMLPVIQGIERTMSPEEAIKYFDKLF